MFACSDLCNLPACNVEYSGVDKVGHPILVKIHSICSRHGKLGLKDDQALSDVISDEADRQNEAYAAIVATVPGIPDVGIAASVTTTFIDDNGTLVAQVPHELADGIQRGTAQVLVDAQVGAGKVVVQ